jgi:sulfhydrogenase subunit alpha
MTRRTNIDVHHVTRIEGHGNISLEIRNGQVEHCAFEVIEAPRFIEAILRGQRYDQVSKVASRICGICAVTHTMTSLLAVERALGIQPSEQTTNLRKLIYLGELIDSHILHIYMLVAPDLVGVKSVIGILEANQQVVARALRMKKVAGDLCAAIGGRHTHPISMVVGGFSAVPSPQQMEARLDDLKLMRKDVADTVEFFQGLQFPEFERETEYIALIDPQEYAFAGDQIGSSDGVTLPVEEYQKISNEFMIDHSTAKHCRHLRESYMVGALARFNLGYEKLHPQAKSAAAALGIEPLCVNPYLISIAQLVELVHCTEAAIELAEKVLGNGLKHEPPRPPDRLSGRGIGASEAPRGTLYHAYEIEDGILIGANCVIPTGQNLANIEADMKELVPQIAALGKAEISHSLEMLVRAYDPCISCSTHVLILEDRR